MAEAENAANGTDTTPGADVEQPVTQPEPPVDDPVDPVVTDPDANGGEKKLDMVAEPAPVALIAPPVVAARSMGVDREAAKRDASRYTAAVNAMRSIGEAAKSVADEIENVIGIGHPDLSEERVAALRHAQRGLTATHEGLADVLTKF